MVKEYLKIAVLMGWNSAERQVSLQSGSAVASALENAGHEIIPVDLQMNNLDILDRRDIDVFFIALHGEFGEDGQLQLLCEKKKVVYTGSGPISCGLAMNKTASRKLFANAGLAVPPTAEFYPAAKNKILEELKTFGSRFVVKPVSQGSSVGVEIVDGIKNAIEKAQHCFAAHGSCIIEKFICGREITVGIVGRQTLPIIEIRPKAAFYDYHAKYIDDATEYLFDTIADSDVIENIHQAALRGFDAIDCRDFGRVDFILDEHNVPYLLEINSIPGFTKHSLLPMAAAKVGMSMTDLCMNIINLAMQRNSKSEIVKTLNG